MSSFWKKTMVWLGLEDEEIPEGQAPHGSGAYPHQATYPQQEAGTGASSAGVDAYQGEAAGPPHQYVVSTYRPSSMDSADFEGGSGVRMLPATEVRVHVVEPAGFNDAQDVGERFRLGDPVIIELSDVERDTARRLVDFASGLTFGLRGRMKKVGEHAFLLMPASVSVPEEEWERIRSLGYDV